MLVADRRARIEVEKTLSFASDIAWHCMSSACVQEKKVYWWSAAGKAALCGAV